MFSVPYLVGAVSCLVVAVVACGCGPVRGSASADMELVRVRTLSLLTCGTGSGPRRSEAVAGIDRGLEKARRELQPLVWEDENDGEFPERLSDYCQRVRRVAAGYATQGCKYYKDPEVLQVVLTGLDHALTHFNPSTPRPGNWHRWLILIPDYIGSAALMVQDELPAGLKRRMIESLSDELQEMTLTGANAAWEARNHCYLAMLSGDYERLNRAAARILTPVRYSSDSGVTEDYAFLFHGHIPYIGGYGSGYVGTISEFMYLFDQTRWAADTAKLELMANLLLEHARWYVCGDTIDPIVRGRSCKTRNRPLELVSAMLLLGQMDFARADELNRAAMALIEDGATVPARLSGVVDLMDNLVPDSAEGFRYWYTADLASYKGDGYHVGLRQYSKRVQDYEFLTRRGGDGWNLAYGFTSVSRSGSEIYDKCDDVRAVDIYDWDHLPGTTSRVGGHPVNDFTDIGSAGHSLNYGRSEYSGGCGFGSGGVAAFKLIPTNGDFTANKSVTFFPGGFVALGSAICSDIDASDKPVNTTVLQWPVTSGDVEIKFSDGQTLSDITEPVLVKNIRWAFVDSVGCVFYQPTDIYVKRTGHVVTIWLDHSTNPKNASYEYAVLPNTTEAAVADFAASKPVKPLAVSPAVHAVVDAAGGAKSVVFFEPGQACGFASDSPAILHLSGEGVLNIQNSLHDERTVNITVPASGEFVAADGEVGLADSSDESSSLAVQTKLGRIYRCGFGSEAAGVIEKSPREDLSEYYAFTVTAENRPDCTILTMRVPDNALVDGTEITLRGFKGHQLKTFSDDDIVEVVDANTVKFCWDRKYTPEQMENKTMSQSEGDFRIYLRGRYAMAMDYFSVPRYDENGNASWPDDLPFDRNNPHWYERK